MNFERNIQLIIEYDGSNYCGWQVQKNGVSIQEVLNKAIQKITKEDIYITGSGRTDAGVHALGQSAHFKTQTSIPINKIPFAINSQLPKDIRIQDAIERNIDFHSRYSAVGKIYEYKILNSEHGSALDNNRMYHIRERLDIDKMRQAAKYFLGTHDFTGFSSVHSSVINKVRTIDYSDFDIDGTHIIYTVRGNGFLYNMVRIIIGTLIQVGKGKIDHEDIPMIIGSKERAKAGPTAPAHGLYLQKVLY
ncbi:tRNA pseudouridine38-40 synthase [Alkalibaculum bacchi]|uniref:tRNA pseudouridine synthase A n=1 Tax=Alkalibaculum bacchi TaxID=645887 RepID=A0A366ICB1_9FIRM|nr:tRNA pseudouridine(38-40) synthase TruA [Alkalibaculum bacchi]RBP67434.1 tRNA pseudouridine38-40 synthase [Alkalibaculum bacchi]